ncbi:MAG: 50S ribosomal protein L23 [Planctomycetota bacterium]
MKRELTAYEILRKPVVTEKVTDSVKDRNTWAFEIAPEASRQDVRKAVEYIYHVKVRRVNTSIRPGKPRHRGRIAGMTRERKMAWVTLSEGQVLDVF